jgi:hypothetical protein
MLYKRRPRRRRSIHDGGENGARGSDGKIRGGRFTLMSFFAMAGFLVVIKAAYPGAQMRIPVAMVAIAGLACFMMSYIARRM